MPSTLSTDAKVEVIAHIPIPTWDTTKDVQMTDSANNPLFMKLQTAETNRIVGIQLWWYGVSTHSYSSHLAPTKDIWLTFEKIALVGPSSHPPLCRTWCFFASTCIQSLIGFSSV
jgi:hypothetical protein